MDSPRSDRSKTHGLRVASPSDAIDEVNRNRDERQQHRRVLRRAAQFIALAVALLGVGAAIKFFADQSSQGETLGRAEAQLIGGTQADLEAAIGVLAEQLERRPNDTAVAGTLALARAHLWLEFGIDRQGAEAAIAEASAGGDAVTLARAAVAFSDGDVDGASTHLQAVAAPAETVVVLERAWLTALVAVARGGDALEAAASDLATIRERYPDAVTLWRVSALVEVHLDRHDDAMATLAHARELSPSHVGLAADEALYSAHAHRELAGVASVADQLLVLDQAALAPRDRGHALLARAVAHVREGEPDAGLARLEESYALLAPWDARARELALLTAAEAADAERVRRWLPEAGLDALRQDVFEAWALLIEGRIMASLEKLEAMPQETDWVAYLQGLALVEQRRFTEAQPWLERAEKLLPGRIEVEVARARVDLRSGDATAALRRLEALAEEEPFAPRAWTGLGEAYLLQDAEARDLEAARKALSRAVDREPVPAEAMLLLAEVWNERRSKNADAIGKALELMEKAAAANPYLPRYKERLAIYLAQLRFPNRARALFEELDDARGLAWPTLMARFALELESGAERAVLEALLDRAESLGADARTLDRARAQMLLEQGTRVGVAQALAQLSALLDGDRADVETRISLARAHLAQGERKTAETTILRGLRFTPSGRQARLHFALAEIQAPTGQWVKAAPRARRAWTEMLEEDRPPAELLDLAELATRVWLREGSEVVALRIARELTEQIGFHTDAWTIRAVTELGADETAEARTSATKAVELDGENPRARTVLGDILLRYGQREKAQAQYRRALELTLSADDKKRLQAKLRRL